MPVVPTRLQDFIQFADMHAPVWTIHAVAIGLTPAQATAFSGFAAAASNAYTAKLNAEQALRAANLTLQTAVGDARRSAGDMVRTIRAFAENASKPEVVYNLAQIPPPATPTPMPPPGQPTDLSVTLVPTSGAMELRWKAVNPTGSTGTSYIVRRREEGGGGDFTFVGVTGEKRYVDSTFFAGPDRVEYTVQGQRADSAGPVSDIFIINFGRVGPGLSIVASGPKMAAA